MLIAARTIVLCLTILVLCTWPECKTLASPPAKGSFGLFKHTAWTEDDGAPTPIGSVVRGADGFVYIASGRSGLYSFDGYSFEKAPETSIAFARQASASRLLVTREGELWVGYAQNAGIGVMRRGRMLDTGMIDPPPMITELQQSPDGTIWAAYGGTERRLWRFADGKWQCMDDLLSLPNGLITSIVISRDGVLWLAVESIDSSKGFLLSLSAGSIRLQHQSDAISFGRIGLDPRGRLWVVDRLGIRILRDELGRLPMRPKNFMLSTPLRIAHLSFDSAGALWGTTGTGNIFRIASAGDETPSGPVDLFGTNDGLTADNSTDVVSDREGNVWVTTEGGLERFRKAAVRSVQSISVDSTEGLSVARAISGEVYVASAGQLFAIAPSQDPRLIKEGLGRDRLLCAAQSAGVWISGISSVSHIIGTTLTSFAQATSNGGDGPCAEDRNGRLWVGLLNGLDWHDETGWHRLDGLPRGTIWQTLINQDGNLVFLLNNNAVGIMNGNNLTILDEAKLGTGAIKSISIGQNGVLISGHKALARLRSGNLTRVTVARAPYVDRLRDLIQTDDGLTWMMSLDGISEVETNELDRAFGNADAPLTRKLFDAKDGLQGRWQHVGYRGTQCVAGKDGRLWFLTGGGLATIDPTSLHANPLPPVLAIKSLVADGKVYRDFDDLHLPPGTSALDIKFAALSLTDPGRNQYRYRLDGVENAWLDPGQRREASYTNLGAGRYVFHLRGSNNDGVWAPGEATASFIIEPTFVQTSFFKFLCALLFASLLWLAYSVRLRAITSRVRLGVEERLLERERIARELHDTLLQSISGLMLRFEAAAKTLPPESSTRGKIDNALDLADKVIAEGRDRVRDLRDDEQALSFEAVVRDTIDSLQQDDTPACDVSVVGRPRRLDPVARAEALSIVRESLVNAHRHARARRIDIVARYGYRKFEVSISDDGIGIDGDLLGDGKRQGHYGLTGMRERASKLRGTLMLERLDQGTRVTLTIPGFVAFSIRPHKSI